MINELGSAGEEFHAQTAQTGAFAGTNTLHLQPAKPDARKRCPARRLCIFRPCFAPAWSDSKRVRLSIFPTRRREDLSKTKAWERDAIHFDRLTGKRRFFVPKQVDIRIIGRLSRALTK
ncbi:hypothetical protein [Noviherbaspirillum pedocola]|uniref:Uncharacterized protein n=1 Tax=Noviherbaspirillum pedocola TaxID=2801341 RepID=A0A934SZE2_9BURK|nr:hypothetical protein [Noviherbaspirillum pedocola]MBK4735797.1 hypothetical protein [Noviherbaspirillum pedocola]